MRKGALRYVGSVLLTVLISAQTLFASAKEQQVDTPEISEVRHFLDSIEKHDLAAQLDCLMPDAQAYRYRGGKLVISSLGDVLKGMAKGSGALTTADASKSASEPIDEVGSKSFGHIATVWTRYRFIVDGKVHHHGHTIYSLIKSGDRWVIANVVDEAENV